MIWTQKILALCAVASVIVASISVGQWVFESKDRKIVRAAYKAETIQSLQETLLEVGSAEEFPLAKFEAGYALRQLQNLEAPRRIIGSHISIEQADLSCLTNIHLEGDVVELKDVLLHGTDLSIVANKVVVSHATAEDAALYIRSLEPDLAAHERFLEIQYSLLENVEILRNDSLPSVSIRSSVISGGHQDLCCGTVEVLFSFLSDARIKSKAGMIGYVAGFRGVDMHRDTYQNRYFCIEMKNGSLINADYCPPKRRPLVSIDGVSQLAPWSAWFLPLGGVQVDLDEHQVPKFLDIEGAGAPLEEVRIEDLTGLGSSLRRTPANCAPPTKR